MRPFFNPFSFLVIALIVGAGLAALTVLCNTLLPDFVRRGRDNAAQHPHRAFLIGLVNLLFFGLITVALLAARVVLIKAIGVIVATTLLTFLVLGAATIARLVGERLRPGDANSTRQVIAGIVTIEFAEMFPLVGWIVVPLLAASTGLGAVILTLFKWRAVTSQDAPTA